MDETLRVTVLQKQPMSIDSWQCIIFYGHVLVKRVTDTLFSYFLNFFLIYQDVLDSDMYTEFSV